VVGPGDDEIGRGDGGTSLTGDKAIGTVVTAKEYNAGRSKPGGLTRGYFVLEITSFSVGND